MDVAILYDEISPDAPPDELDTVAEVSQVAEALARMGYRVQKYSCSLGSLQNIAAFWSSTPDVVFNLVETLDGAGSLHLVPLFCGQLGIPVTGGGLKELFLTSDKVRAKHLMRLGGVPTPEWFDPLRMDDPGWLVGVPLIVKPKCQEASVGIGDTSVVTCGSDSEIGELAKKAGAAGCFMERYIVGREFNVSIISRDGKPELLPPAEIRFFDYPKDKPKIVGYEAKWEEDSFAYGHTVRSFSFPETDAPLLASLDATAEKCWRLFGGRGYGRVDFRVDGHGTPFVLEVNVNPCVARDSGFCAAGAQGGYSYDRMIGHIVQEAIRDDAGVS